MNVEAVNWLFEEPAPESSIGKPRSVVTSQPPPEADVSGLFSSGELAPGTIIDDDYRIERKLREGAMGLGLVATRLAVADAVALPFMRRDVRDGDARGARFDSRRGPRAS